MTKSANVSSNVVLILFSQNLLNIPNFLIEYREPGVAETTVYMFLFKILIYPELGKIKNKNKISLLSFS